MIDSLAPLLADGVIEEIVRRLKSGKEADLWLVRHAGEIVAAKVYKQRQARSFHNNAAYKEGRLVRNTRTRRAMERGTRFGQAAAEDAWKAKEAEALHTLHAAGVRVPKPVMFYEGVLLMEVIVDAGGNPAPRLIDAHVPRDAAAALYSDLRGQMIAMLCCDLVHGDLSPYNVLLGSSGPVVIDFPQVVGAAHNNQAEGFFGRDLENLRRFFGAHDAALRSAAGDAREIWRAYARRELTPGFVPSETRGGAAPRAHPRAVRAAASPRGAEAAPSHGHRPDPGDHGGGAARPDRDAGTPRRDQRHPEAIHVGRAAVTPSRAPAHAMPSRTQPAGASHPAQTAPHAPERAPDQRRRRRRRRRRRGSPGGNSPAR
jgi:RIO kinase 1